MPTTPVVEPGRPPSQFAFLPIPPIGHTSPTGPPTSRPRRTSASRPRRRQQVVHTPRRNRRDEGVVPARRACDCHVRVNRLLPARTAGPRTRERRALSIAPSGRPPQPSDRGGGTTIVAVPTARGEAVRTG